MMKNFKKLFSIFLTLCFLFVVVHAWAFAAGDKVSVEWKGQWYAATVVKSENGRFFIHYDGWEASWDEWVGSDRIKK